MPGRDPALRGGPEAVNARSRRSADHSPPRPHRRAGPQGTGGDRLRVGDPAAARGLHRATGNRAAGQLVSAKNGRTVSRVQRNGRPQGLPNFLADCFLNSVLQVLAGSYRPLFDPQRNPLARHTDIQQTIWDLIQRINNPQLGGIQAPSPDQTGAIQGLRAQLLRAGLVESLFNHEDAQQLMSRLLDTVSHGSLAGRRLQVPGQGDSRRGRDGESVAQFAARVGADAAQVAQLNDLVLVEDYLVQIQEDRQLLQTADRPAHAEDTATDPGAKTPSYQQGRRRLGESSAMIPVDLTDFDTFHAFLYHKFGQGVTVEYDDADRPRALRDDQPVLVKKVQIAYTFTYLPRVVTFYLKRFRPDETKEGRPFPMPPELFLKQENVDTRVKEYRLESYVVHTGGVGGGHYRTHRATDAGWYEMDDDMPPIFQGERPVRELDTGYIYTYKLVDTHAARPPDVALPQETEPKPPAPVPPASQKMVPHGTPAAESGTTTRPSVPALKPPPALRSPEDEAAHFSNQVVKVILDTRHEAREYFDHWIAMARSEQNYDRQGQLLEERQAKLAWLEGRRRALDAAARSHVGRPDLDRYQDQLEAIYGQVQQFRIGMVMSPKHIIFSHVGEMEADQQAARVIKGDIDYRVTRLAAVLGKGKRSKSQDRFNAAMKWLAGGDGQLLRARYAMVAREADELTGLEADLAAHFQEGSLKHQYLLQVLDDSVSPTALLALKLGLLYEGHTPFTTMDKGRVESLVRHNPQGFAALVEGTGDDQFAQSAHQYLRKKQPRFLGELKSLVSLARRENAAGRKGGGQPVDKSMEPHADYLTSLYYSRETDQFRNLGAGGRVKHLVPKVLTWATELATPDLRRAFVYAAVNARLYKPAKKMDMAPGYLAFVPFWYAIASYDLLTGAKIRYLIKMVDRLDAAPVAGGQNLRNLIEVEAILEKQAERWVGGRRREREGIMQQVLALLSAGGDWDPQLAVLQKYNAVGWGRYQEKKRPDLLATGLYQAIDEGLRPLLEKAGLTEHQVERVRRQLLFQGSYGEAGDTFRQIDAYQELKDLVARTGDISGSDVLKIVRDMNRDTLDAELIRRDQGLLRSLRLFVRDLGTTLTDKSRRQQWRTFLAIVGLPESEWDRDRTPTLEAAPTMLATTEVEKLKQSAATRDDRRRQRQYWAGRISALYLKGFAGRDANRILEVAFSAQLAGIKGAALAETLQEVDSGAHAYVTHIGKSTGMDRAARKLLKKYFKANKDLELAELLASAKLVTKHGADKEAIDFTVEGLSPEDVIAHWVDPVMLERLRRLADERFQQRLELMQANIKGKGNTAALQQQLDFSNRQINQFELRIRRELESKLQQVTKRSKRHAIKRAVALKINEALQQGQTDKLQAFKISAEEREAIGLRTLGVADIKEQRYLESGVAWHHRSTAATEASGAMAGFLGKMWQTQQELAVIGSQRDVAPDTAAGYQERRRELIAELRQSETTLREAQQTWKETQDRLNEQTRTIVMVIVGLLITAAGLVTGIGAAPGLIQVFWMLGSVLLEQALKYAIDVGLKREGDADGARALQDTVVALFTGTAGFLVGAELALAVDLAGMGWHTGTEAQQIFGKPLLAIAKQQITSLVGDVTSGAVNRVFAKHPISRLLPDIMTALKEKLLSMPKEAFITFVKGVVTESLRIGNNKLLEGLLRQRGVIDDEGQVVPGHEDVADFFKYQPTGSAAANFPGEKAEQAQGQLFDFSQPADDWTAVNLGIFVGGPTRSMGSDVWAGSGDYDAGRIGLNIANAAKTILYEEYIMKKVGGLAGRLAEKGYQSLVVEQDPAAASKYADVPGRQKTESPEPAPGYESWDDVVTAAMLEAVTAKTLRILMAGMGVVVDPARATPNQVIQAVMDTFPQKTDDQRQRKLRLRRMLTDIKNQAALETARAGAGPLLLMLQEADRQQRKLYAHSLARSAELVTMQAAVGPPVPALRASGQSQAPTSDLDQQRQSAQDRVGRVQLLVTSARSSHQALASQIARALAAAQAIRQPGDLDQVDQQFAAIKQAAMTQAKVEQQIVDAMAEARTAVERVKQSSAPPQTESGEQGQKSGTRKQDQASGRAKAGPSSRKSRQAILE